MINALLLTTFGSLVENTWTSFTSVVKSFNFPIDLIDIAVMAYVIYQCIRLLRETRAMQLVKGIAAILVVYFFASQLQMITLGFVIRHIISVGVVLIVVLFQPEIRSALEKMGRTQLASIPFGGGQTIGKTERVEQLIDVIVESCNYLSPRKTGALMVIERQTKLGDVIKTGTQIDAEPSVELIGNIFFTNSPLHDGAMVFRGGRLFAAGCYLPLSQNMEIARDLGTRHRASLGMSEVSDAVVVVVSEETGAVSVACESKLARGLSEKNLREVLRIKLLGADEKQEETQKRKFGFWRVKK